MARPNATGTTLSRLQAENATLRAENKRLKQEAVNDIPTPGHTARLFRKLGSILFVALAVALLVTSNLLLWTGNTVVKPERFKTTVTPIIQDKTVQTAIAGYTTDALFNSVDVQQVVSDALPPRADFLAPTIASSLQGSTQSTLKTVLARPQFQDRWNNLLTGAHAQFINGIEKNGSDGAIDINELYQQLGNSLQGTKLSFLAGHKLPAKVGTVQVVQGDGITVLHRVITHIDTWRTIALVLFLVCAGLSIYLSRIRRRGVLRLALLSAAGMFVTLVSLRVAREIIAGKVQSQYAEAVRHVVQIVFHPLVVQTTTIMIAFLLVALVAWLTGGGKSALFVRSRVELLFAGKLHQAIFGNRENNMTRWVGTHKHYMEWGVVSIAAVLMLLGRLTPKALVVYVIVTLLVVLVIELLGAPAGVSSSRKTA